MARAVLATLAVAVAASLAGCGDDDDAPEPPPVERRTETPEKLPKLPRGFERHVNRANGLALGRPPGWKATNRGATTLLRAPDRLVVMSLSADRTDEALGAEPRELATRTFQALEGYKGTLDPSKPRSFKHRYEAFAVKGKGVAASTGVRQRLRLIVLRRKGAVVMTAVIAENSEVKAPAEVDQAIEALRTLRTRPVG